MMNIKIVILGLLEPKPIIAEKDLLDSLTYGAERGLWLVTASYSIVLA